LTGPSGARQSAGVIARMIRVLGVFNTRRCQAQLAALAEAVIATVVAHNQVIEQFDIEDVGRTCRRRKPVTCWKPQMM
jgi:hypothetical protein